MTGYPWANESTSMIKKYPKWCPSCSTQVEDSNHLMTCPAANRVNLQKECFTTLQKQLHEKDTAPPIIELLQEGLHATFHNLPADTIVVNPAVANVAESQAAIG